MVLLSAIQFMDHQLEHCTPNHGVWVLLSAIQFKDHQQEKLYSQSWSLGPFECNAVQGSPTRNTVHPIME